MGDVPATVTLRDGATIWTASARRPGAPAVVFLHGGAGMWDYLEPVAEMVADLATTHRYDQRGCGRSSPDTEFSTRRFVADLDELRAGFGHDRWSVVGHSFGAELALDYAAAHPERVRSVVYLSGVGLDWPAARPAYKAAAAARLTDAQQARLADLDGRDRTAAEEVEWRTLRWLPDHPGPGAEEAARRLAVAPYALNRVCNAMFNAEHAARGSDDEIARCGRVSAPVLIVHGDADPRPMDGPRRLVAQLPEARLHVVPGAGHLPWLDRPGELRGLLREALRST